MDETPFSRVLHEAGSGLPPKAQAPQAPPGHPRWPAGKPSVLRQARAAVHAARDEKPHGLRRPGRPGPRPAALRALPVAQGPSPRPEACCRAAGGAGEAAPEGARVYLRGGGAECTRRGRPSAGE